MVFKGSQLWIITVRGLQVYLSAKNQTRCYYSHFTAGIQALGLFLFLFAPNLPLVIMTLFQMSYQSLAIYRLTRIGYNSRYKTGTNGHFAIGMKEHLVTF